MFFNKKIKEKDIQTDNPYWMSFSDMMSGMLIVFILLCITLILRLSQMEEEWQKRSHQIRQDIFYDIKEILSKNNITVSIDDNDSVLHIPEKTLEFKKDDFRIQEKYKENVKKIGCALYISINRQQRYKELETVFIEGHADSDSKKDDKDIYNFELSAKRAVSLWNFWITDMEKETCGLTLDNELEGIGVQLEKMTNYNGKHLFSVSGYGSKRQAVSEQGLVRGSKEHEEAQAANRRIDIRITTRQPTIAEIRGTTITRSE